MLWFHMNVVAGFKIIDEECTYCTKCPTWSTVEVDSMRPDKRYELEENQYHLRIIVVFVPAD